MSDFDPNETVALMFHGLISDLQTNDVERFEAAQKKEREARRALRHQDPAYQGMNAGELLKKLDGDPADDQKRIDAELARMSKEAQAAAAEKDKDKNAPLPAGYFPPPPTSG
jgi:hypothetical protein